MNTQSYHTKLFTQASLNAVFLTAILNFLMHPFVLFGFHFPDLGFLAWIYLVPLALGIHQYSLRHKFILSFFSSMIAHYGMFYWVMTAMQRYGGLNFFQAFGCMTLMFVILSAFFALPFSLASWIGHFVRLPFFLLLPLFMVTHDFVLARLPLQGFPWEIVPYSQGQWLKFFQWVDHSGIFGLGLFIYLINGLIAEAFLLFLHRKHADKMVSRFLVVFVLGLMSLYASFLASQNYEKNKVSRGNITAALIQGNISQDIKWNPYKAQDNLGVYLKLTNMAVKDGAEVVIWPETAYPYSIKYETLKNEKFLDQSRLSAPLLFGAVVSRRLEEEKVLYNSVVYGGKDAGFQGSYFKRHLVPFGEYVPFKKYLGFFSRLTQGVGDFIPGTEDTLFDIKGFQFASLICFEDLFSPNARGLTVQGGDILINHTNDAWYGDSSAQYQHLVFSQFRALENRRYLLRGTNTGLTAVINPRGEVVQELDPFTEGYLSHNIKVDVAPAFYTSVGDTWVFSVTALCFMILLYAVVKCLLGPVKIEF